MADLGDPATFDAGPPYGLWARMRARSPVCAVWSPALSCRFWCVTGWEPIRRLLADDATFVSRYGVFLGFGPEHPDPAGNRMLVVTDGERRTALRAAMRSFFTPRAAAAYDAALDGIFTAHLLPRLDAGPFDFAQDIAWRAPMLVACAVLGVPPGDADRIGALARGVLTVHDPAVDLKTGQELATHARAQILDYFKELIGSPTVRAGDNLTARLLEQRRAVGLTVPDVLVNLLSMLVAANETTRLSLTGAMVAFAREPAQLRLLRDDPGSVGPAVEEVLRWTSPGLNVSRTAARDTVLGSASIRAGESVTAWLPAGNRDPAVFERPDRFELRRPAKPHVTLGHGPHHCIGAALARAEIAALLRCLREHGLSVSLTGMLVSTHSNSLWGYAKAPMEITTRFVTAC
jgi:hydroxylation protein CepL